MKSLRVTKSVKKTKFEKSWEITIKKMFQEKITHKICETNFSFLEKKHTTGKVYCLFFKSFFLVLTNV